MTSHSFLCSFHAATWHSLHKRYNTMALALEEAAADLLQYHSSLQRLQRFSAGLPHALRAHYSQHTGAALQEQYLHFGSSMNSSKLF